MDERVQQVMNERAHPTLKTQYSQLVGAADALRLGSLQYSFNPSGFLRGLAQAHLPTEALGAAWDKAFTNNAYSSGTGPWATVQTGIEALRGVVKIIGEIAGMVSAIAGAVEVVAAIATGITAIFTGPGAAIPGAVMAIAAEIALAGAIVQLIASAIDTLLGIVQIVILIGRAKATKDPAERARICQLLKRLGDESPGIEGMTIYAASMKLAASRRSFTNASRAATFAAGSGIRTMAAG